MGTLPIEKKKESWDWVLLGHRRGFKEKSKQRGGGKNLRKVGG